jgi:hypothetical protein
VKKETASPFAPARPDSKAREKWLGKLVKSCDSSVTDLTCSADAVDVVLDVVRHVEVDHYPDVFHV